MHLHWWRVGSVIALFHRSMCVLRSRSLSAGLWQADEVRDQSMQLAENSVIDRALRSTTSGNKLERFEITRVAQTRSLLLHLSIVYSTLLSQPSILDQAEQLDETDALIGHAASVALLGAASAAVPPGYIRNCEFP
jgi:hypothetical protein